MKINDSIAQIPGIGPSYQRKLNILGIYTISDFLYHIPTRYIDYSLIVPIASIQEGEMVTLTGEISSITNTFIRGRRLTIQKATLKDNSGIIKITFFNQPYLVKNLTGKKVNISGKITGFGKSISMESPESEVLVNNKPLHTGRLVAVYPETEGLSSKFIRNKIEYILNNIDTITDPIPTEISEKENLISLDIAIRIIHQPKTIKDSQEARRRLAFDELFLIQLVSQLRRRQWHKIKAGKVIKISKFQTKLNSFIKTLPFDLTDSQKKVIAEITNDLNKKTPMNRLLQGEVGSGKTIVAAICSYLCYLNGYKTLYMAPTEILSNQHYKTFTKYLTPLGIKIGLQTGSTKIENSADIIIGTHALLFKKTAYKNVALVIIDEQHRFGVVQRSNLKNQHQSPHLLTMTATPIPRTIALTLYGDLDLSIIDQMPKGRKIVKTYVVAPEKYSLAFRWIRDKIKKGKTTGKIEQAYIIYPLIEESEILKEVKAAKVEYQRLKKEAFWDLSVGLLHGKLAAKEKNEVMHKFRKGEFDVLVSTSVVEVGMDIPSATIMVVEDAFRFGLSQLHQLRGRVGRSDIQSYCLLFSQNYSKRLKSMETIFDGIKLSELDLKLRGAGEIYGVAQHGMIDLKIADFSDLALIEQARKLAEYLLENDESLTNFQLLKKQVLPKLANKIQPD